MNNNDNASAIVKALWDQVKDLNFGEVSQAAKQAADAFDRAVAEIRNAKPVHVGATLPASELCNCRSVFQQFVENAEVGDMKELPVAVCKTDRVVYDGVDRIVMLNCRMIQRYDGNKAVAVICPCYPGGLQPGVSVGIPMIAAKDMRPRAKPVRRPYRGYRRY
jgi:hypothetical protein